jgi:hypothetical protein
MCLCGFHNYLETSLLISQDGANDLDCFKCSGH